MALKDKVVESIQVPGCANADQKKTGPYLQKDQETAALRFGPQVAVGFDATASS